MAKRKSNSKKSEDHLLSGGVASLGDAVLGKIAGVVSGGVTPERFFVNRDEDVHKVLEGAGYKRDPLESKGESYAKFQIGQKNIPSKSPSNEPYYKRLFDYAQMRLNAYNPGLGDYWRNNFPLVMKNQGNTDHTAFTALRELALRYAPGTYRPEFKEVATAQMNQALGQQAPTTVTQTPAQAKAVQMTLLSGVRPIMEGGLKQNGSVPIQDLELLTQQFYNEIVAPSTSSYEIDHVDEAVANAVLTFIATIAAKKAAGEALNPVYEKIANVTQKVQEEIGSHVKTQSGNVLGNWILDNPFASVLIVIVVGLILAKLFKVF